MEYTANGTAVMVDNLLDIGDNDSVVNNFDAEAMSYYHVPKSTSHESDLLGLNMNTEKQDEDLPQPIFPLGGEHESNENVDHGTYNYQNNHGSPQSTLYHGPCSTENIPQKTSDADDAEEDDSEDEEEDSDIDEQPIFGSVRASILQIQSQQSQEAKEMKDRPQQTREIKAKSKTLGSKPSPIPPPRPSKRPSLPSTTSTESLGNEGCYDSDDAMIEALTATDLSQFSAIDIHSFINTLFTEIKSQRAKVKESCTKIQTLKQSNQAKINKMVEKINIEKEATATAVEKVMKVQQELQQYKLRYSGLDPVQ